MPTAVGKINQASYPKMTNLYTEQSNHLQLHFHAFSSTETKRRDVYSAQESIFLTLNTFLVTDNSHIFW